MDPEELSLVASGQMTLPKQELDQKRFWAIGAGMKNNCNVANAIWRAMAADREEYGGLLGHKRDRPHLRAPGKAQAGLRGS